MRSLIEDAGLGGNVELVYIDPPFSTSRRFTVQNGRANTISQAGNGKLAYDDSLTGAEYLSFIRDRLELIRELMSETGSIYLHTDLKTGHLIRMVMDEVFGAERFRNQITRIKCNPKNFKRRGFGNVHDIILVYSKGEKITWNPQREDYTDEEIRRLFRKKDEVGRRYTTIPLHAPGETKSGATGSEWRGMKPPEGRHWRSAPSVLDKLDEAGEIEWSRNGVPRRKIYADTSDGKLRQDVWEFKDPQNPGYPTEKNIDMVKTIVAASSNPGDIVLDCFCGSGTTLQAAGELGRRWIGIDSSRTAIDVAVARLGEHSDHSLVRTGETDSRSV